MKQKKMYCADLFCGGGGTSSGMIQAFVKAGIPYELFGINHWKIAIATNRINHPQGHYRQDSIENISPRVIVPGGYLDYLWASPECTNHSRAKGGRPKDAQSRSTAWHVLKWAQELYIRRIFIENVEEFLEWGPLYRTMRPNPARKGKTFQAFINVLKSLDYKVEWRIMNAADYGAPTCRKRLIIQAVRGSAKIQWPEPTHSSSPGLFKEKPYVPARDIIDWSISGQSIFSRKIPLAPNTLRRIYSGVLKYWGSAAMLYIPLLRREIVRSCKYKKICPFRYLAHLAKPKNQGTTEPFMVVMRGTKESQDNPSVKNIGEPVATINTRNHMAIVKPFISRYNGGANRNHSLSDPIPPQDCSNRYAIVEPIITSLRGTGESNIKASAKKTDRPMPTVTANGTHHGLVEGFVIATGQTSAGGRSSNLNDPISTIVTKAEHCIVEPLIVDMTHTKEKTGRVRSGNDPLNTITTRNNIGVAAPMFIPQQSGGAVRPVTNPLPTIATEGAISMVSPFITKYYGNENSAQSIENPLDTVTTKERFGLADGQMIQDAAGNLFALDILFRMFQPHELAAAMSFPADYKFAGNKGEVVKQIGNAVPPVMAEALIAATLSA